MRLSERWFPSHLEELTEYECREHLTAHRVGRVAYCDEHGPVVVPVNYTLDGDGILLRLSPHTTLANNLRDSDAAFQLDDVDDLNHSGWSVLVRGHATAVEAADHPAAERLVPWPAGHRPLHIRLEIREITGRRLNPA